MGTNRITLTTLLLLALPAASFAQGGGTLELPVDNGPVAAPAKAAPKAPDRAAPARSSRSGRSLPPLPSRAGGRSALRPVGQPAPKKVLARVGSIVVDRAEIHSTMSAASPVLSIASRDVNLAVLQESDTHYGVLMSNNTLGWVAKTAVQLIDYNTEVTVPADEPASGEPGIPTEGLTDREQAILREALSYLGVPYVWAGNTRQGLDCSGFVKNVYRSVGVDLPRHSGDQARVGQSVVSDLRPGDRLYFAMKGGAVSHCGIYLGNNYFIHASSNHKQVAVDQIYDDSHYAKKLVSVRR